MLGATLFPLRFSCQQILHQTTQQGSDVFSQQNGEDVCGLQEETVMAKQQVHYVNDKGRDTAAR